MNSEISSWSDKDFLAFLMIYASKADTQTTEDEILWIRDKCKVSSFENLMALYNSQSDYENIQTIQDQREKFFPGEEGKTRLGEFLRDFFQADGRFSLMEQNTMRVLTRLL